jgi:hypothetical protein
MLLFLQATYISTRPKANPDWRKPPHSVSLFSITRSTCQCIIFCLMQSVFPRHDKFFALIKHAHEICVYCLRLGTQNYIMKCAVAILNSLYDCDLSVHVFSGLTSTLEMKLLHAEIVRKWHCLCTEVKDLCCKHKICFISVSCLCRTGSLLEVLSVMFWYFIQTALECLHPRRSGLPPRLLQYILLQRTD